MAQIYMLALLAAAQASFYAANAMPVNGHGDDAGGYGGNAGYESYFPGYAMPQGYNKDDTQGHHNQALPIPSQQQSNMADEHQYPSSVYLLSGHGQDEMAGMPQYFNSPYPVALKHHSTGGPQYASSAHLSAQGWQPPEAIDQLSQFQGQVNYHFDSAGPTLDRTNDPEIRAELQDPNLSVNEIMELAMARVNDIQFKILDYYSQPPVAALGSAGENTRSRYEPAIPNIVSAIKENHFIVFLYVDVDTKQLMLRHPYSDKMFREVDFDKLQAYSTTPEYFSSVYTIPMNTHHFVIFIALSEEVDRVNFSNDPVRNIFEGNQMPPQNTIFKSFSELGLSG
ncbi:hypothetical protein H4R34_003340 [Dimargaris verticillata]|uniref:Uncharacterized protein n=1 Tax=Dimargaris verticillata TaxID=2761393 RepID=A0A9W8B2B8_9FUNG|nr:hypothetical protein H4R34_003340 [Dimargaris verticillata]